MNDYLYKQLTMFYFYSFILNHFTLVMHFVTHDK